MFFNGMGPLSPILYNLGSTLVYVIKSIFIAYHLVFHDKIQMIYKIHTVHYNIIETGTVEL